jgi:hypothetical protein
MREKVGDQHPKRLFFICVYEQKSGGDEVHALAISNRRVPTLEKKGEK